MNIAGLLATGRSFSVRSGQSLVEHAELVGRSDRIRDALWELGVRPGDRVGLRLHKSIDAVAAIFGVLKAGAAYVPVDVLSPVDRGAFALRDCRVRVALTESQLQESLETALAALGAETVTVALDELPEGPAVATVMREPEDIAYILYTSGSTGQPKGVVLTHGNAMSFIRWCSQTFAPTPRDVFSSHAPFHFDLSILDLFLSVRHGSQLILISEEEGKDPLQLARIISECRITHWYSTPSILNLLSHFGKLEQYDFSGLRTVLFAGEVFPIPQFRVLHAKWPQARFFNLYGPTETNVCTWYEVPPKSSWAMLDSFPIGAICEPNEGRVVDEAGEDVPTGAEGELIVSGPNVMKGYWERPELNARAFLNDGSGRQWYRTGDIVTRDGSGCHEFRGRRDRMIKRRGFRVELGEIEAALMRHPDVREAAAVSIGDTDAGLRIVAFVSGSPGHSLGIIELKQHSARNLPPYMIPDFFRIMDSLPRTSTDKIDLRTLRSAM